uniref:CUB domain-containing protein n=1 Tax=Arion vulgaris TaxID=1028688 RepID=A0A0B7AQF6_9EUPU
MTVYSSVTMTTLPHSQWRYGTRRLFLLCLLHLVIYTEASYDIFFSRYGDCDRRQPFLLADEDYTLKPVGGTFVHENLICTITFKAPTEYGICLTFDHFKITDCSVRIKVYSSSTSSGMTWRVLDCSDTKPNQMCTSSRYVTVQLVKDNMNSNKGYNFKIDVEKSNSITEKGVLFASIGVFVGVILGVVALTAILAISILYCCCKHRKNTKKKTAQTIATASHENRNLVQPSAPPIDIEDRHWASDPHFYPPYGPYPPPPYVPPPPYQPDDIMQVHGPTNDHNQISSVKP